MKTMTFLARVCILRRIAGHFKTTCLMNVIPLLLLLTLPAEVQVQLIYKTDNGQITITGWTSPAGAVEIPSAINR